MTAPVIWLYPVDEPIEPATLEILADGVADHILREGPEHRVPGDLWEREAERAEKFDAEICYIAVYAIDGKHAPQIHRHRWTRDFCDGCGRFRRVN